MFYLFNFLAFLENQQEIQNHENHILILNALHVNLLPQESCNKVFLVFTFA